MRLRWPALLVSAVFGTGVALAQRQAAPGFAHPPSVTPGFATFGFASSAPARIPGPRTQGFDGGSVLLFANLPQAAYAPAPVSVVIVQSPAPALVPHGDVPPPIVKPLLLELRGERWVQVEPAHMAPIAASTRSHKASTSKHAPVETSLVFRDGHQEKTLGYAVIGDDLYIQNDYWSSGRWTTRIPMAILDLPMTIKANQQHGIPFRLPTSPNEVVLQP